MFWRVIMDTVMGFLKGTPWYVYLILAYLIFVGIKSVKGGVVPIQKLFIIPIVFCWMSVNEITKTLHLTPLYITACLLGLFVGICFGVWQFKQLKIRADKTHKLLEIEGSWFALVLIIITFIVKYYVAYSLETNQDMSIEFICILLFASSIFTGAFVGRLLYGLYKLNVGPHVDLIKP